MDTELWRWDARALANAIRSGKISSREATDAVLARLEAVNPGLNAVTVVLADQARTAADRADAAVRRGEPLGPLHGVPVTIKENVDQEGSATTNGVVAFKDLIATTDSPPVANWRRASTCWACRPSPCRRAWPAVCRSACRSSAPAIARICAWTRRRPSRPATA